MSKTAMKLALEALENAQANFGEWWPEAITALREALAEQKSGIKQVIELYDSPDQPAQQEPVGEVYGWHGTGKGQPMCRFNATEAEMPVGTKLYTSPLAQQQAPVAWMMEGWGPDCGPYVEFYRDDEMGWRDRKEWTPLYTSPPAQRKPLTDEQIEDIWADCPADWDDKINVLTLARAIETAHGIKGDA